MLGELYVEAAEAAYEAAETPEENYGQAKVRRWLKSEHFETLCHCAEVEEEPTRKFFEKIITAQPEEARYLSGRLQDMLREWDVCEADREKDKIVRMEYRITYGLKLLKKDHAYIEANPDSLEARRRKLAEKGLRG